MSEREKEELNLSERRYEDGTDPQVLDAIDVPLLVARPKDHQVENWLIDSGRRWVKAGRLDWASLFEFADHPETLWINGQSSANGSHDRIGRSDVKRLRESVYLIRPEWVEIAVCEPAISRYNAKPQIRAEFEYKDYWYRLCVTDPVIEVEYQEYEQGTTFIIENCFLTISLGEQPLCGYCYKLIAAIITPEYNDTDIPF